MQLLRHSSQASCMALFVLGKPFYYRGCGWRPKRMTWSGEEQTWIGKIDQLLSDLFGPDYCNYEYTEKKHCVLVPGQFPLIKYDHDEWEKSYYFSDNSDGKPCVDHACTPGSDSVGNPVSNPDCQPISNPVSNRVCNPVSNADCKSISNPASNCACNPVSNPDCKPISNPDTRPFSNPVSHSDHKPNDNPGYTCKTSSKLDCSNHKAGYKPDSKTNRRVIPDIGSEDKENTSVEMTQGKKHLQATFRYNSISHLTRGERASLKLPKVVFVSPKEVHLVESSSEVSDPHLVNMRPAESIVKDAMDMLTVNNCRVNDDDDSSETLVTVGKLGTFTLASMKIFQNMCTLQSDAVKLQQERNWLSQEKENLPVINKIQDILENSRPHDEIFRQGFSIIDVNDFSTLACERYVNGFIIDAVCLKLLHECLPTKVVYLPTYSQTWARQGVQYFSEKVNRFFGHCKVQDVEFILAPVHFETPKHWGLLCFECSRKTVYFDDGLRISPPRDIFTVIRNMLGGFRALSDNASFDEEQWNQLNLPLPRINMPAQTRTGVGSGSCGVGVILTVRDIICSGNCHPLFLWKFENMDKLRKELMTLILQWRD